MKAIGLFLLSLLTLLTPIKYVLIFVCYIVVFDTIFSIIGKQIYNKRRKKKKLDPDLSMVFTSNRFFKSIPKLIFYYGALILGFVSDNLFSEIIVGIIGSTIVFPFTYFVLLIIMIREFSSIDETVRLLNDNKGIKYYTELIVDKSIKIKDFIKKLVSTK